MHAVHHVPERILECSNGYVALVTFDVSQPFNTAPWYLIVERMRQIIGDGGVVEAHKELACSMVIGPRAGTLVHLL